MASKPPRSFLITLERDGPQTPWGIRLVGGSDLNTPIIITKVFMKIHFNHICWFFFRWRYEPLHVMEVCDGWKRREFVVTPF